MARVYDGETILKNMLWDLNRMIEEKRNHEEILNYVKSRVIFLDKPKWHRINWWSVKDKDE